MRILSLAFTAYDKASACAFVIVSASDIIIQSKNLGRAALRIEKHGAENDGREQSLKTVHRLQGVPALTIGLLFVTSWRM